MATQDEIATLRRTADLAADDDVYTDLLLNTLIDGQGINASAAQIWREKAAGYAALVDMTESGSSRKLSDLHENALRMAAGLEGVEIIVDNPRRAFTTQIERL